MIPAYRTLATGALVITTLLASACSSRVATTNPDAPRKGFTSFGLLRVDIEYAAKQAVDDFLATDSRYAGNGPAWVVQMGDVINDTTADVDTASLTSRIKNYLRKQGRFVFSAADGTEKTDFVAQSRERRYDPSYDSDTLVGDGTLQSARLEMSGAIRDRNLVDGRGRKQRIEYEFDLRIVDAVTGLELFQSLTPIDKTGGNRNFTW